MSNTLVRVTVNQGAIVKVVAAGTIGPRGPAGNGAIPNGGLTDQILAKLSDADGDAGWRDELGAVESVNSKVGIVVLTASDVGAATPTDVTNEAVARAAAITTEATARSNADTTEAASRASADTTEASSRVSGDATNASAISSEATARANADALLIPLTQKAAANGVASLDSGGRVPAGQLPSLVLSHTFVVGSQAAMLALSTANTGDLAVRTDSNQTFILNSPDPTQLINWTLLLFPGGGAVSSVNTRTGAVTGLAEASTTITAGAGLSGGGDLSANRTISMPNVGTAGTTGDATHVVQLTTDAQGRVTGATAIAITGLAESAVTGLVADLVALTAAISSETSRATAAEALKLAKASNLSDLANAGTARSNLGLGNVDNTSDANKPVSTAQAAADALNILKSILTTKGGLLVASAAATPVQLPPSTDGLTLTLDSTQTAGVKWGNTLPARFGGFRAFTHSYGSVNGNASLVGTASNFIRRVAAGMNIPVTEIEQWYHAGMMAALPNIGDIGGAGGIGGVFRQSYPDHAYGPPGFTTPTDSTKANPFLDLICAGVNDQNVNSKDPNTLAAVQNGLRAVMTRLRAGRLYAIDHAALVTSGTWTSLTDKNYVSYAKYKSTATLGDTITFTIPATYKGGPIALTLLGDPNCASTLSSAMTDTTGTSAAITSRTPFPQSGAFVIQVDSEQMLVGAGNGAGAGNFTSLTRGYNGTTAATHLVNAVVTRPTNITYLDFTGSTANLDGAGAGVAPVSTRGFDASGRLMISGQGTSAQVSGNNILGTDIQMVARFTGLTSTDAGKTIVAKFKWLGPAHVDGDVLTNQFFRPFDVVIEDIDPPVQLVMNQPIDARALYALSATARATLNANLATLVGEFANAYLVDVATYYSNLFGATIQTATGTGESTIKITPNSATLCTISKGSILMCNGELFLATGIDKTNGGANDGTWLLTVTTNYSGTDAPTGTGASLGNANHPIGNYIIDVSPFTQVDGLHPSDLGHLLFAAVVFATLATVPVTTRSIAASGGYGANNDQSWPNPASGVAYPLYRTVQGAARSTLVVTQSLEYADPFWIPRPGVLTYFGIWSTAGAASSVARFGFYTDFGGAPGILIFDLGTLATPATTGTGLITQACLIPVKRGWYWRTYVPQGGAPTVASTPTHSPPLNYAIPDLASNLNGNAPVGLSRTPITGALTDWTGGVTVPVTATAKMPLVVVGFEPYINL